MVPGSPRLEFNAESCSGPKRIEGLPTGFQPVDAIAVEINVGSDVGGERSCQIYRGPLSWKE